MLVYNRNCDCDDHHVLLFSGHFGTIRLRFFNHIALWYVRKVPNKWFDMNGRYRKACIRFFVVFIFSWLCDSPAQSLITFFCSPIVRPSRLPMISWRSSRFALSTFKLMCCSINQRDNRVSYMSVHWPLGPAKIFTPLPTVVVSKQLEWGQRRINGSIGPVYIDTLHSLISNLFLCTTFSTLCKPVHIIF